jgi:hypothetical protein
MIWISWDKTEDSSLVAEEKSTMGCFSLEKEAPVTLKWAIGAFCKRFRF